MHQGESRVRSVAATQIGRMSAFRKSLVASERRSWVESGRPNMRLYRRPVVGCGMSVAVRRPMTMEAFLAWEEGQELRWEFDGFAPTAMTGGTAGHSAIQRNLVAALTPRLRGNPCQVYTADLKIRTAGSIRYPDAFVVCSPGGTQCHCGGRPGGGVRGAEPQHRQHRSFREEPGIPRHAVDPAATSFWSRILSAATVFERDRQTTGWGTYSVATRCWRCRRLALRCH